MTGKIDYLFKNYRGGDFWGTELVVCWEDKRTTLSIATFIVIVLFVSLDYDTMITSCWTSFHF